MGCSHDCDNKTEFGFCRTTACTNPKYNGSGTYIIGKPMEQRSEPTTAEIVESIEQMGDLRCDVAAYRLEQLERQNAEKDAQIAALTARAEKAEAERDAAISKAVREVLLKIMERLKSLENYIPMCDFCAGNGCKTCYENGNFEYRGLRGTTTK